MEIVSDAVIPYPREQVFATYRDCLADLAEHLPNIRSITVQSRTERGSEIDFVNEWVGGGDIPAVARSVLKESMLRWTDHATWHQSDYRVDWRTDIHAFPGAITCSGQNRYIEVPQGTRLEIRGQFRCDAAKIPGVPRLFAKSIGATVEKVMVAQIGKNSAETAKALEKILAKQATR